MNAAPDTTVLFRPVGPDELALIQETDFSGFPPRLEGQPYFYPVQNEEYAIQIARDWNAKNPKIGAGFVTRFRVRTEYLDRIRIKEGRQRHPQGILDSGPGTFRVQPKYRRKD